MAAPGHYRTVNLALAGATAIVLLLVPLAFDVTSRGDGVELLGSYRLPELCLSQRLLGRACPSCNLGRSAILLLHADLEGSLARHSGGVWLVGWAAVHGLYRAGLALAGAPARFWPIDLGVSLGSFLLVCVVIVAS